MSEETREITGDGVPADRRSGEDRRRGVDRRKEDRGIWHVPVLRRLLDRRSGSDRRSGADRRRD